MPLTTQYIEFRNIKYETDRVKIKVLCAVHPVFTLKLNTIPTILLPFHYRSLKSKSFRTQQREMKGLSWDVRVDKVHFVALHK